MLINKIITENIYAIGDTHTLDFVGLLEHYSINNAIILHVGDAGEGFCSRKVDEIHINNLNKYCSVNNVVILIIRGNHSNPEYFNKHHWANQYENIEFVEDYCYKLINGKKFLFVGGATSIDRQVRTTYRDYWPLEKFVLSANIETLEECDFLITHTSAIEEFPNNGFDHIAGWFKNDPTLKQELIEEREKMSKLYNQVKPKKHLNGHFHMSHTEYIDNCLHKTLDINEIYQLIL